MGLYARNVHGITLQNIRFQLSALDMRPALIFDHVEDAAIKGMSVPGDLHAESVVRFIESRQTLFTAFRVLGQAAVFLQIEGARNEGISIDGGDLSKAASAIVCKNGASENSVKIRT